MAYQGWLLEDGAMSMTDLHGNKQNTPYPYIQYLVKLSALCTFPYNSVDTEHFTACR